MYDTFLEALHADQPAADRAGRMGLYAWLIGRWEMSGIIHSADAKHEIRGKIYAGWILEGRALQDVWIAPGFFHGTTLRVYDPTLDAWHIVWSDPLRQSYTRQIGRPSGNDIIQQGTNSEGAVTRWSFVDITDDSFRWRGERLTGIDTWKLEAEFFVNRAGTSTS